MAWVARLPLLVRPVLLTVARSHGDLMLVNSTFQKQLMSKHLISRHLMPITHAEICNLVSGLGKKDCMNMACTVQEGIHVFSVPAACSSSLIADNHAGTRSIIT